MGEELTPPCFNGEVLFNLDRPEFRYNRIDFNGIVVSYPSFKNLTIREERVVKIPSPKIPT